MLAALVSGAGLAYTVAPVHPPGVAVSRLTPACSRRAAVAVAQMPDAPPEIVSSETYSLMIRALLETENSIASEISSNYEMIDYGFLQMLDQRIAEGEGEVAAKDVQIEELGASNANLLGIVSERNTEKVELNDLIASKEAKIRKLTGKVASVNASIKDLTAASAKKEEEFAKKEEEFEAQKKSLTEALGKEVGEKTELRASLAVCEEAKEKAEKKAAEKKSLQETAFASVSSALVGASSALVVVRRAASSAISSATEAFGK